MPVCETISDFFAIEECTREAWDLFKGTHIHNCYELYYMRSGEITYFIEEKPLQVTRGEFILVPPGVGHKTLPYHQTAHSRILVYFRPEFLQGILPDAGEFCRGLPKCKPVTASVPVAWQLLSDLLPEKDEIMEKALLVRLLILLKRWYVTPEEEAPVCEKAEEIRAYLRSHYAEDITLSRLGAKFYLSPAYLSRLFRRQNGVSFSEYLIRLRLSAATELLNHSNQKISEIARNVGFHSDNHFCKTFRKYYGISPGRFRKGCSKTVFPQKQSTKQAKIGGMKTFSQNPLRKL